MPRKQGKTSNVQKTNSWKSLHHRIEFSPKDEIEIVEWAKGDNFDLPKHLSDVLSRMWSFKVSPMDDGERAYCTVQCKDPNEEFGDHSFGFIWRNSLGAIAVVCYVCLVMAERGDLYKSASMQMTDVLDFLA